MRARGGRRYWRCCFRAQSDTEPFAERGGKREFLPYPVALAVKERLGLLVHLFIGLGLGDTGVECRGICVDLPSVSVFSLSVIRDVDYYYCK